MMRAMRALIGVALVLVLADRVGGVYTRAKVMARVQQTKFESEARGEARGESAQRVGHLMSRNLNLREGLLQQYARLMESTPHTLTLMCVGETGVGKSSLISNLFTVPVVKTPPARTEKVQLSHNEYGFLIKYM